MFSASSTTSILTLSSFDAYTIAAQQFTYSQACLKKKNHAAAEIDRVLIDCITKVREMFSVLFFFFTKSFHQARPVYLSLPTDLVSAKISTERLRTPLTRSPPPNDPQIESFVIDTIVKRFDRSLNLLITTFTYQYRILGRRQCPIVHWKYARDTGTKTHTIDEGKSVW